jgi:NADH-quinone oxidoreductase subunit E
MGLIFMENTLSVNDQVTKIAEKWKGKEGNLIMILHEIQGQFGYIPRDVALNISKVLDIPLACIYEVITFYNYFKLEKPGKVNIAVCMGTACYLKGAPDILEEIKNILNIKEGQTTPDGYYHLDVVRCLGCCGLAPVIMINEKIYSKVQKSQLMEILSKYKNKE